MTSHGQRGLQLSYNFINLPSVVSGTLGAVTYSFSADGTKVAVEDNSGNGYQYMGSLIYAKSGSTLTLESARFAHGYIAPQDGQVYYHTTDHLGSVRAITNMQGSVVERNGYYPFGSETALGSSYPKLLDNRMKFNGKEVQTTGNLGLLDYGARMYDPAIGRWTAQDPLSEKYYSYSPYGYCVNSPSNTIDVEGNLVIFINGLFFNPIEAGTPKYWGDFDDNVMAKFNDHNSLYLDGSIGGIFNLKMNLLSAMRFHAGYYNGAMSAQQIFENLTRDSNGNIVESIKIITHSMGGVYSKGFIQALLDYMESHLGQYEGLSITEYNFAPFQPTTYAARTGVDTYQYSHKNDRLAGNKEIPGVKLMDTSTDGNDKHSIAHFLQYIINLPQGKYVYINGEWIEQKEQ